MKRLFAAGALFALGSCAEYQAHVVDPVQAEARLRAKTVQAFTGKPLDLTAIEAIAITNSAELDVARAKAEAAAAALITARQRINPSLSAEGGYNRTPESVATYSVSPAFTIETAGKRGYRILQAEKLAEAARIAVYEAEWQIRNRVRTAAVNYFVALNRLKVSQSESAIRDEITEIFTKRVAVGEAANPELNAAGAAQAAASVALHNAEGGVSQSLTALAAAAGLPVTAFEAQTFDFTALEKPPALDTLALVRVEKAGLLHRADIRRTLIDYEAADARLRLELANRYPNISLNPAYAFQEGFPAYTLGSVIESLPVFHRNQGGIAEAAAARHLVETQFVALQAQAIGQTEFALRQYTAAVEEWNGVASGVVTVARAREEAVLSAFRSGDNNRLDVAQARLLTTEAAGAQLDALLRAQTALGALEDAVQSPLTSETTH